MIDLHCHLLPGVDVGAASLSEALAMARILAADGVTHVTATPHCNLSTHLLRADILPHVDRLNEEITRAGIPLTVLPGSEIQVYDPGNFRAEYEAGVLCHLGDRPDFTLFEFSWRADAYPAEAVALIRWLRERGTTPIIAHPERHHFFQNDPDRVRQLIDAGAWLQITVDSLLGNHGQSARTFAEVLVRTHSEFVLATDAHNLGRCSGLSAGYTWLSEHLGADPTAQCRERSGQVLRALTEPRITS